MSLNINSEKTHLKAGIAARKYYELYSMSVDVSCVINGFVVRKIEWYLE